MDKSEKNVILNEIANWRSNRFLPAEYCDFLTNLYSEGEAELPDNTELNKRMFSRIWLEVPWKTLIVSLISSLLLLLFVLHFTSFPNWMQMVFLLVLSAFLYVLAFVFFFRKYTLRVMLLVGGCGSAAWLAYILASSIGLLLSAGWSLAIFVMVMLLWVLTGTLGSSRMIAAAGWTGITVLYEYALVYAKHIDFNFYAANNAYWLLFGAVSTGIGLWLARAQQYTAAIWAVFGATALVIPEFLYLLSGTPTYFLLEITAFLKVSMLVSLLVVFRLQLQSWFNILHSYKM